MARHEGQPTASRGPLHEGSRISATGPDILRELKKRNPKDDHGNRPTKHHQWLTANVGHPRLAEHLYGIIGLIWIHDDEDWTGSIRTSTELTRREDTT